MSNYGFDTLAIHGGNDAAKNNSAICPPVYQTNAYDFGTTENAAELFELKKPGHIYSRISNPTVSAFEDRMAMLEGGAASVAFASGHNAIFSVACCLAGVGDEIVSSSMIYGGAVNLFAVTLKNLGIKVNFVDCDDLQAWENAITDKTKFVFFETVGNPNANVADIQKIAEIAHRKGVLVVCDATFSTPYLCRPLRWGADIVIHSATKFICGHGNAMAGIVTDGGTFRFEGNPRYRAFSEPDPSYHGVVYTRDFADAPFAARLRTQILRDIGGCLAPMNAYYMLLGLETLSLRMDRHCENARKVAEFLADCPKVKKLNYPGLPSSPYYERACKYLPKGVGSIFTFEIDGGREEGGKIMDKLRIFANVANVGDLRSMVIHPATTTHSQLTKQQLEAAGIGEGTIRISVGLETADDLIADIAQALR